MPNNFEFLIYNTAEGDVSVNAVVKDETIWLTQKAMAQLFDCSTDNISLHLKNIYQSGELVEEATAEDFSVVRWLPRQLPPGNAVPHLGNQCAERVHDKRLCTGR